MLKNLVFSVAFCSLFLPSWAHAGAMPSKPVEELVIYTGQSERDLPFRVWSMNSEVRDGRIFLNTDNQAKPWAGIIFKPDEKDRILLELTPEWISKGFVRFYVNGLPDAYGNAGPSCGLQLHILGCTKRYERINDTFYEGGAGIDSDPKTWQQVMIPIGLYDVKPGDKVTGIGLQCRGKPVSPFAVATFSLARFRELTAIRPEDIAQPWVTWPAYGELPETLKFDRNPPFFRDGKFVTADGRRAFLIMPWTREDQRANLGINQDGILPPNYGLYDPETQAFIYETPLTGESMSRLGFNCCSPQVDPRPFWDAIGYKGKYGGYFTHDTFVEFVRKMNLPFYVDMVCFPWTLGRPGEDENSNLPRDARHNGKHHWTPYRIIGKGREIWLTMWTTYARRYKEAGANVIFYELMNEPAYQATTADHRAEFIAWLKRRYGTLNGVNGTWGTDYASWDHIENFGQLDENTGIFFDYDEYLGDRFADLIAAGCKAIEEITPGVPAAIQCMGQFCLQPREAIYLSKLIPVQRAVLTPTGGGRWTRHIKNNGPKKNTMEYGMSAAPIANDLLLTMAGEKMIVDNEMYLRLGQTRHDMRNRWWKEVIVGMDGAVWFSWSKRGWAWWRGIENVVREGQLFPYSGLIPPARRADAIRGTLEFAREMELVRDYVLPKPWGPPAKVAMLYSWANARWRTWEPQLCDKSCNYHAAMRYLHWNFDVLPSHVATPQRLDQYELLVAGAIDHIEPELLQNLTDFVRKGGTLIVGEEAMNRDLYDKALDSASLLGVAIKGKVARDTGVLKIVALPDFERIPGKLVARAGFVDIKTQPSVEALMTDSTGRPMVTRHALGEGNVCYIACDLAGYSLAKILGAIRARTGPRPNLIITNVSNGQLAPNILVSRRSYKDHHALLLLNGDDFPKLFNVRILDLEGNWYICDPLEGYELRTDRNNSEWIPSQAAEQGVPYCIAGENRGLLLFTRTQWTTSRLVPADEKAMKTRYEKEFASWTKRRGKIRPSD